MAAVARAQVRAGSARFSGSSVFRWVVVLVLAFYFLLPLYAMLEFSTRGLKGRSSYAWVDAVTDPDLTGGIRTSLELAAITVVVTLLLLVPTIAWVRLRVPRMRRVVEFACLLPIALPAIALVGGIAQVYNVVYNLIGGSPLTLTFIYVILALPFAYRSIDAGFGAIDAQTLAEAARTLGYSWPMVIARVLVPNLRGAIMSAAVITVALVLGEFTIASLLNFNTLQVEINLVGKRDAEISVAVSMAALLFGFILLLIISIAGRGRAVTPLAAEDEA
ncbi:MAG: ABC transporter permease subunit [Chloroflexi bacterium]|nr:ABC transporter permease subunit [Chloroflexota bacterium]